MAAVRWLVGVSIAGVTATLAYPIITQADRIAKIQANLWKDSMTIKFDKPNPAQAQQLLYQLKPVHSFAAASLENTVSGVVAAGCSATADQVRQAVVAALTAFEPDSWKDHQIDVIVTKSPSSLLHEEPARLVDYVKTLELKCNSAGVSKSYAALPASYGGDLSGVDAKTVDGKICVFKTGVTTSQASDALNSMLLAQLAANHVADRHTNVAAWYNKYFEVLENIGWAITSFDFTDYHPSGDTFAVDTAVLEVLAVIATGDDIKIMQEVMTQLKAKQNQPALTLFSSESNNNQQSNFQVGIVWNDNGVVSTRLGAFNYTAKSKHTQVLFFSCSPSDVQMAKSAENIALSDGVYSNVRDTIVQKLGDKARSFVSDLDLS